MPDLFILRGLPGSGKSDLARSLADRYDAVICSADQYFMVGGKYCYDSSRLAAAHAYCQSTARKAMVEKKERVIIDNTNADPPHFRPYEEMARQYGYTVRFLVVENRHGGRSAHFVPQQSMVRALDRILGSLSLAGPDIFDK